MGFQYEDGDDRFLFLEVPFSAVPFWEFPFLDGECPF